jgi:hypothetical protein
MFSCFCVGTFVSVNRQFIVTVSLRLCRRWANADCDEQTARVDVRRRSANADCDEQTARVTCVATGRTRTVTSRQLA